MTMPSGFTAEKAVTPAIGRDSKAEWLCTSCARHRPAETAYSEQSQDRRDAQCRHRRGMTTLLQDGIQKCLQGQTTFKEVKAVAIK